jgi:hypothetical protein
VPAGGSAAASPGSPGSGKAMKARMFRVSACLSALLLLAGAGRPALGQETASLPYAVVYRMLTDLRDVGDLDRLYRSTVITSTREGVSPADIRITLDDGTRTHEFTPDGQGNVSFPLRADWDAAGLVLHTNQPAGSLALGFGLAARPLTATRLPYRDLLEIARQFGRGIAASMRASGEPTPDIAGLQLRFPPGAAVRLVVLAAGGEREFVADDAGSVWLPDDAALWAENPEVRLDRLPEAIVPWVR